MTGPGPAGPAGRGGRLLVLVGIVLLALNLRPAVVSVGPVLDEVRDGLAMSATAAGVLTSLPVLAFALFGALAPRAASALGAHRLVVAALTAMVVGLLARSRVDDTGWFLLLSGVALAGVATANVVMPSLVRLHFPDHVGRLTAVYSTALAIGLTGASVLTVPLADGLGDWRDGLATWTVLAVVALVPWLALVRHDAARPAAGARVTLAAVARTRLGWAMALLFGLQSLQAYSIFGWVAAVYRDAGFSDATAGVLLGVVTGTSIPMSVVVPLLTARLPDVRPLLLGLCACFPLGYVGLALAPDAAPVLWALVLGVATSVFPMVLTLIGLRARTPEGTASLSAFTQSVGYLLAALGPFGVGVLHDVTGGWTVPLLALAVLSVPLLGCGLAVARPRHVEDEMPAAEA